MIDSHAHLAMFGRTEWADVLDRAAAAGITSVLVPATGPGDFDDVVAVAQEEPERVVIAIGVHPHEARHLDQSCKRRIEEALRWDSVVAIGEIGLDYHYDLSPREDQRRAFTWQLGLAVERGLPVVLHHREAWDDFLAAVDEFPELRGVAHSFTEGAAGAGEIVARGLFVGISGMVTFPKADNIREGARAVPADRLLIETDSPYLAPVPHRGQRNEPAFVRLVAERVAAERGVSLAELEASTDAAFKTLFGVR